MVAFALPQLVAGIGALSSLSRGKEQNLTVQYFKTEPTFRANILNITRLAPPEAFAQGYFFLASTSREPGPGYDGYGPQIFDQDGQLVWYGNASARHRAMRFHVCDYLGEQGNHLCWHDGWHRQNSGHSQGVIRMFDSTYTQAGEDFGAVGRIRMRPDAHEINTPPSTNGRTLLQIVAVPLEMELMTVTGADIGWTLDSCFQEVDVETRDLLFQWCANDYMPVVDEGVRLPNETYYTRSWVKGSGKRKAPRDIWHMNGVDMNEEGDYLISVRHLDTVVKIAGRDNVHGVTPGKILWTLNGEHSSFQQDFNFSRQHTARFVQTGASKTTITLLDNARDGRQQTADYSRGLLIEVDNSTMHARLLQAYPHPMRNLTKAAGATQLLPNGNVFVGWGRSPYFSEYDKNGTLLYYAKYTGGYSPQVWKYPWTGNPVTRPKLVAYSLSCEGDAPLVFYASWNGATAVRSWRFHTSNVSTQGPWHSDGFIVPRAGFETRVKSSELFANFAYVDALDAHGAILATSESVRTFVPDPSQRRLCNEWECIPPHFEYYASRESACDAETSFLHSVRTETLVTIGAFLVILETCVILGATCTARRKRARADHVPEWYQDASAEKQPLVSREGAIRDDDGDG